MKISDELRYGFKYGFKDKVFATVMILLIVFGIVDFYKDITGFALFMVFPFFVAVIRGGFWIWMYRNEVTSTKAKGGDFVCKQEEKK